MSAAEKINLLKKCFKKANLTSDKINAEVLCPNKKCKSNRDGKLKLIIQIYTQQYNCWVCGISGVGVGKLVNKYAYRYLNECFKLFKSTSSLLLDSNLEEKIDISLPENFVFLAESFNAYDPDIKSVISYAKSRGINLRDFWYFKLGAVTTGRLKNRVILPSFDKDGNLNYYVARTIFKDSRMKYINSKVPKKDIIFNEINIDWKKELTLVEGPFDLIKTNENSTCLLGCSLREDQILFRRIVENNTDICLALDPDVMDKAYKIAELLSSYGINVRMLDCTGYEDVGAMKREEFDVRFKNAKTFVRNDRLLSLISSIKSGSMI